jgi:hypothetical protein
MHPNKWLATLLLLCSLNELSLGFAPLLKTQSRTNRQTNEVTTQIYVTSNGRTASGSGASAAGAPTQYVPKSKRSYYEILGANPTATKTDLKKQYVALARLTHPDALIGRNDTSSSAPGADFSEISQAWKVLSNEQDRRKYDRTLQAEDFKQNVEQVATAVSKTAGPSVKKAFTDFAVPFLRRTTVTTVATVSAAVDKLSSKGANGGIDLGSAVASAMRAREAAGRVVDAMEFLEKSDELEKR